MKEKVFNVDKYQSAYLTSAFRDKSSIISFWMRAVKIALAHVEPDEEAVVGEMAIRTAKMQRIFFQSGNKAFSASFPFAMKEVDGSSIFSTKSGVEINSKTSSEVISFLESEANFSSGNLTGFMDSVCEASDDPDTLWQVLCELMCADDGYIRLDHDPERQNGRIHPLDHIDIFYSQGATFKLGLDKKIVGGDFVDLLDRRSDCHYLGRRR